MNCGASGWEMFAEGEVTVLAISDAVNYKRYVQNEKFLVQFSSMKRIPKNSFCEPFMRS